MTAVIDHTIVPVKDQDESIARNYKLCYGKRPEEELYDCAKDPYQMVNLANAPEHAEAKKRLGTELTRYLVGAKDPRALGQSEKFLEYPIWYRRGGKPGESIFLKRDRDGKLTLETRLEKGP